MNDKIYLICGKSGAGKTTVVRALENQYGLKQIPSYTTRFPRYHNEPGHIFVCDFDDWCREHSDETIVGYTYFDCNHYWATQSQVETHDMYVIDKSGIDFFRQQYRGKKKVIVIYIDCPASERFIRMRNRGDSLKDTIRRLWHDYFAFKNLEKEADFVVSNGGTADWCARRIARCMGK